MRAGPLRHLVEVQRATEGRASDGGVTQTWSTLASRRASIEPLNGREFFEQAATQADISHRIRMRHFEGLTPKDRIVFRSRVFELEHVRNVNERGVITECLAREVV